MKQSEKNTINTAVESFLNEDSEETIVCDLDGKNCSKKHIKRDKSILERINKTIIVEDGRQLIM